LHLGFHSGLFLAIYGPSLRDEVRFFEVDEGIERYLGPIVRLQCFLV
jgi:hypothetical protein